MKKKLLAILVPFLFIGLAGCSVETTNYKEIDYETAREKVLGYSTTINTNKVSTAIMSGEVDKLNFAGNVRLKLDTQTNTKDDNTETSPDYRINNHSH